MVKVGTDELKLFRHHLFELFESRREASFELIDALCSQTNVQQVVELSLNPHYRRNYCSITRSLAEFYPTADLSARIKRNQEVSALLATACPKSVVKAFHTFALDCTNNERLFSPTLADRSPVYTPRPAVAGNKPITYGHQYSVVAYLPEKLVATAPPWVVPLSAQRVSTVESSTMIGMKQLSKLMQSKSFKNALCVSVTDSAYSKPECLLEAEQNPNQIHISRLRNNRTLVRPLVRSSDLTTKRVRGRPKKYNDAFKLIDTITWGTPDHSTEFTTISQQGKPQLVKIQAWQNITMRHAEKIRPFRVVRIDVLKGNGERLFKRALWLLVAGVQRDALSLQDIFTAYRQRFDIEHFFRFGKTRLLLDKFQTPEVVHEEAWWQIAMIAYTQLYLARGLACALPNPWEKGLPAFRDLNREPPPRQVQKSFSRIIREIGTPAKPPKTRNKSKGRVLGQLQTKRQRHSVVYKSRKSPLADTG